MKNKFLLLALIFIIAVFAINVYNVNKEMKNLQAIDFMMENNLSFSCAESCTGGLLAAKFIERPGISKIFYEGIVAYDNDAKIKRLGVNPESLKNFGAVSEQVALEMLDGLQTDVCISTTGIAGPKSDDSQKPVGLVYIGLKIKNEKYVRKFNFSGNRSQIRNQTVDAALKFLNEKLGEGNEKNN